YTKGAALQNSYTYNGVGSRTTAQLNGVATSYSTNSMNAYTSIFDGTQKNLAYNANGNLTADGKFTYGYDDDDKLTTINGGTNVVYKYDALGRRIQKQVNGNTVNYYFDGMQVVEVRNGSDT